MNIHQMVIATVLTLSGIATAQTTLEYFMWSPTRLESEEQLIDAFERQHPGVTVEIDALPPDQYWPRMSALAAANRLPDVFYMSSGFIEEWHKNGLLANLQPYVEDLDLSDYYTSVLSTARFPDSKTGDAYAFPLNWVGTVLYYNKDAFDAAGLEYPSDSWAWDDFLNAAKALTVDEDGDGNPEQWGFWVTGRYAQIEPWIYMNGGQLLNDARTRLELDQPTREALKFLTDLTQVHKVAPAPKEMAGMEMSDVFPLGMAAMWVDGTFAIEGIREVAGDSFEWGVAKVPQGPSGKNEIAYTWPDMMAVSPNAEDTELAWEFIQFMTGPGREADSYAGGTVPFYQPVSQSDAWLEADEQPDNKGVILELGQMPSRTSFTPSWSEWRGYAANEQGGMNGELDAVFNGDKPLDAAIESFVTYGNEVLIRVYPNP